MADFPLNYPECCATVASDTSIKIKKKARKDRRSQTPAVSEVLSDDFSSQGE